jgi:hypothetical protein
MNDDVMQNMLIQWIANTAKCTTVREYQSGKMPKLPYISVHYVQSKEVRDHEQRIMYEEDDTAAPPRVWAAPVIEVEYMFSVNGFSTRSPTDLLRPIRSAAKINQATEPLMPMFTLHEISEIRNLSHWDNDVWNNRAQMDLFLRGLEADGHLIDTIEEYNFIFDVQTGGV